MPFISLGLSERLVRGVRAAGYAAPTEIQTQAIPMVISGSDVIGCAQTGTGKTAAFLLPILHRLSDNARQGGRRNVRALIVTPTRELALQVEDAVRQYGQFTQLKSIAIYGGVSMEPQVTALRRGVDVVIATPGRLLDHTNRRSLDLSGVEIVVLDEADRMLDMGFIHDVRKIIGLLPTDRQTLLFSATMSENIRDLAGSVLRKPKHIQVGERRNPADSVEQHVYPVPHELKMELLLHVLRTEQIESVLVFSRTKHGANRIATRLERNGVKAAVLHSDRSQSQRIRALEAFKKGEVNVMVATDIAARGIDVEGISHVINFDTPAFAEDYIHRIGRTGRATSTGDALTFVSDGEEDNLKKIERFIGRRFTRKQYPGFSYEPRKQTPHAASLRAYEPGAPPSRTERKGPRESQSEFFFSRNGNSSGNGRSSGRGRSTNGNRSRSR